MDSQELNDENFRSAAKSLSEMEPVWAMQLQMAAGHPVKLHLDFDSLGGRYPMVQPFIHQGLTGLCEAFAVMMMDKGTWGKLLQQVNRVEIAAAGGAACEATLAEGLLTMRVPLELREKRAPVRVMLNAMGALIGVPPVAEAEEGAGAETAWEDRLEAFDGDPYKYAAQFVVNLEAAMKEDELWPGPKPEGEIEVKGAFGCENMPLEQWLAWILIPRVKDIIETRGSFPNGSQVSTYATREFDGYNPDRMLTVLRKFDDMVNTLAR